MDPRQHLALEARLMKAADWLQRLDRENPSEAELHEWELWYHKFPQNRLAFDDLQSLYQKLRMAPESQRAALREVLPAPVNHRRLSWRSWASLPMGLAASIAVLATAGAMLLGWHPSGREVARTYTTARGAERSITLDDGSQVRLGADSGLAVAYGPHERLLKVRRGEAYFKVNHDARRPFIVEAGAARISAVGTAFDVRWSTDDVTVAVTEGAVTVLPKTSQVFQGTALRLSAGQRTVVGVRGLAAQAPLTVTNVEPAVTVAWTEGQLQFVNEPLAHVIASVNRYAHHPVVFDDSGLNDLAYTGTVMHDRADEWIENLPQVFPVQCTVSKGGLLVLAKRQ